MASPRYRFDAFIFDPADGRLEHVADGRAVNLRPQVALFLLTLLQSPRTVIDRDSLRRAVWGEHAVVDFESGLAAIVRELRQSLDQFGGRAELLETIPRRGYRLGADVIELAEQAPVPPVVGAAAPTAPSRPHRAPVIAVLGALVIALGLALLVAAVAWWSKPGPEPLARAQTGRALAVLPFEHYGGGEPDGRRNELLLADSLLAALWEASLPDVTLIGRASLLPYQGRDDVAAAVAADLGVELLIEGSIALDGADWQVAARLLSMPGGEVLWSESLVWQDRTELPVRDSADLLARSLAQAWALDRDVAEKRGARD